jgi:hypothetical protein
VARATPDLKIARIIPRSKFDFPKAISPVVAVRQHLGRKSLQRRVGKTNRRHRAAQMRRAARGNRQRCNFCLIPLDKSGSRRKMPFLVKKRISANTTAFKTTIL